MGGVVTAINAAVGQMTPAQQVLYTAGSRGGMPRRRRKSKTKSTARRSRGKKKVSRARRSRKGKAARFTKGSAAAKRHMAKLRKLRRRK